MYPQANPHQQVRINNNKAIRTLMDDSLMIGRHRPIVANWFQNWVDEVNQSVKLSTEDMNDPETKAAAKDLLIAEIAKQLAERIVVTETKISQAPNWRMGQPIPKDFPVGLELRGAVFVFTDTPKTAPQQAQG